MKAKIYHDPSKVKVCCPNCDEPTFSIDYNSHLPGKKLGPWGCDTCGKNYTFVVKGRDIFLEECEDSDTPAWLVVSIAKEDGPVYFITSSMIYHFADKDPMVEYGLNVFHYEERTCPRNFIPVAWLFHDDDDDPHGVFDFVGFVPKEPDLENNAELIVQKAKEQREKYDEFIKTIKPIDISYG